VLRKGSLALSRRDDGRLHQYRRKKFCGLRDVPKRTRQARGSRQLQKVFDEKASFVPSHVVVSQGKSTTSGSVTPSFIIPLGPGFTNTVVPTGNNQFTGVTAFGAASATLGGNVTLSQEWDMIPATDGDALMRLRTLYLYVTGQPGARNEIEFLCNYPIQRQTVTLNGATSDKNIAYRLACEGRSEVFYADPNFVTCPTCIVCITRTQRVKKDGAPKPATAEAEILDVSEVKLNNRLRPDIVYGVKLGRVEPAGTHRSEADKNLNHELAPAFSGQEILPELSHISLQREVYLKADNEVFFRDFILFTSLAMAQMTAPKSADK
jgi:hypothetical protein